MKAKSGRSLLRDQMIAARGQWCRRCGSSNVQMAHIWSSGTGGPDRIENVVPLCGSHHGAYDSYRMKLNPAWLTAEQLAWLAEVGYIAWDENGEAYGHGWRRFENIDVRQPAKVE